MILPIDNNVSWIFLSGEDHSIWYRESCLIALKEQFLVIHELHFFFHNSNQNNTIPLVPSLFMKPM